MTSESTIRLVSFGLTADWHIFWPAPTTKTAAYQGAWEISGSYSGIEIGPVYPHIMICREARVTNDLPKIQKFILKWVIFERTILIL